MLVHSALIQSRESARLKKSTVRGERRGRGRERGFRALESFLRANTDLSTRRHSWKRNLIREKLNSFKCTSRPLFASYLPPPFARTSFTLCLLIPSSSPPREFATPRASSSLSATSFLFRLLLLSATHLYSVNPFHCENVVLQFILPPPLSL